jgi:hypothetical protein
MIAPVFVIFSAAVFTHYPQRVRVIVKNVCKKRITLPITLFEQPITPFPQPITQTKAPQSPKALFSTQVPPTIAKRLFGTF